MNIKTEPPPEPVTHASLMEKLVKIEERLDKMERFQLYVRAVVSVIGLGGGVVGWLLFTANQVSGLISP